MLLVLDVLLIVFYYLLLRVFTVYLSLYNMYVTMSISIGLYPNLDLWNANKLHYITLHVWTYSMSMKNTSPKCCFCSLEESRWRHKFSQKSCKDFFFLQNYNNVTINEMNFSLPTLWSLAATAMSKSLLICRFLTCVPELHTAKDENANSKSCSASWCWSDPRRK